MPRYRRRRAYFNVAEAKARLSELIDMVERGEEVIIARDHKPVVRLSPVERQLARRTPGSARGRVWMAPDFDAPLPDFTDYSE
jgi:prevent-host-death family protein